MGLTGQNLDVLEVGALAGLQSDGAAVRAARVLEGEGLALLDLELGVEELGLGESNGNEGRDSSDGVLHLDLVWKGRRECM